MAFLDVSAFLSEGAGESIYFPYPREERRKRQIFDIPPNRLEFSLHVPVFPPFRDSFLSLCS